MQKCKFDGVLICSDFDGTLSHWETISQQNIDAIRYFQAEGGLFTVVSGRQPSFIHQFRHMVVPNTYVCGFNGTIIQDYATHERIHNSPLGAETYSFAAEVVASIPEIDYVDFQFDESNASFKREDFSVGIGVEFAHNPLYKVLFIVGDVHSDSVYDRISRMAQNRYSISRGWINGIEIQKLGEDKGNALRILKKQLSGKIHTTVGVGDYENDIPMLLEADISFAVDNAMPSVKAVADHRTASCETSSIASIIDWLERNQL